MKNLIAFFLLFCIFFSCKKDPFLNSLKKCRKEYSFTCTPHQSDFFFSGKIKGEDFCVAPGTNAYEITAGIGTGFATTTEAPALEPGVTPTFSFFNFSVTPEDDGSGVTRVLSPWVKIRTPYVRDSLIHPAKEYLERFIKKGNLPLRDIDADELEHFYFEIGWNCDFAEEAARDPDLVSGVAARLSTINAQLGKDTRFEITELEITETAFALIYDITFEIECDLYWASASEQKIFYGRLEDGVFKTQAIVDK